MQIPFTGGCVCGEVRYECSAAPLMMLKCHCRDCQQITGGPYIPVVAVPYHAFKITKGRLHYFDTPSLAGGHNHRGFCPKCGSRLTGAEHPELDFIGITASSLDDPSGFQPACEVFVCDAQPWDSLDSKLPHYETYPPRR